MKNLIAEKINEYQLLIFICKNQIEDNQPIALEAYIKGKKRAYERMLETLKELQKKISDK